MTAILISTFDRYEWLARWTAARISRVREGHPPIYFSGLSVIGPECLGFDGNVQDWMSVNLQAVQNLQNRGVTHAYLILDDHPPVGPCRGDFLTNTVPELATELDAALIGLLGCGQHRGSEGRRLGATQSHLEHTSKAYRWKFSLHPALWKLTDLVTVLEYRMAIYHGCERTPWNFERHQDVPTDRKISDIATRCYRVHGASCLEQGLRKVLLSEAVSRLFADFELFFAKLKGGLPARNAAQEHSFWRFGHYLGPYPLFWSGTMRQGKPHADFEKWLSVHGDVELKESWLSARSEYFLE